MGQGWPQLPAATATKGLALCLCLTVFQACPCCPLALEFLSRSLKCARGTVGGGRHSSVRKFFRQVRVAAEPSSGSGGAGTLFGQCRVDPRGLPGHGAGMREKSYLVPGARALPVPPARRAGTATSPGLGLFVL